MTVGAHDLALGDLFKHAFPAAISKAGADVETFVAEMVELEHQWVRLTAVDARVCAEELD
jgi:hypothetical protein